MNKGKKFIYRMKSWGKLLATKCKLFLPSHGSEVSVELIESDYNKRAERTIPYNNC
jgi:hypothetical protein